MLPILHLNGYKIANPTLLARIDRKELESLFVGYGYRPYFVEGDDPQTMHRLMAATLDTVVARSTTIQRDARENGNLRRPQWPMIVLTTPKGWTGPKEVDGKKTEGSWRSHQVPMAEMAAQPGARRSCSRSGCGATGPRSSSTRTAKLLAGAARARAEGRRGACRPTRTPTAVCS